jgi:hypothetical protein
MSKFRNIVLPATTQPSSPKDGQIYHDSTLNQIRVYIDGSWYSLGTLFTPENSANKGVANGYAPLDSNTKVSSIYLPSYVDEVLEYSSTSAFPESGSISVIYVALDSNKIYRWSGSTYTEISPSPGSTDSVTEGSVNLYFTNARAQSAITGGASSIVSSNLSTEKVLVSDSSGKVSVSSVSNTTLGYLDATSSIQTQLDNKLSGFESEYSIRVTMGSSTLSGVNGMTSATTGTIALNAFSGSTTIGKIPHVTFNTTSTAGSTTGMRTATTYFCVGGGFKMSTIFQIADATNVTNSRHFFGANTSSSATAINSSSNNNQIVNNLTNFFAFAYDAYAGDTNFCIYHNGNTAGNTTRISLGSDFPIANTGEIYQVQFYNPPASLDIYYRVKALVADVVATGKITGTSSNLPTSSQLYIHNERFNGGSSAQVKFEAGSIYAYTYG